MLKYSEILLEMRLVEMARSVSSDFVSPLTDDPTVNRNLYHTFSAVPPTKHLSPTISFHEKLYTSGSAAFATLDHGNKRAIHVTSIKKRNANENFPHDHIEQELVDKDSNHPMTMEPGQVRNIAYNHWKNQNLPFRSSQNQAVGGHKMWKKYSKQALDDGKFVYYHSPETGFVRLNHDNLDEYHSRYFGDSPEHTNRSLVLSHTAL